MRMRRSSLEPSWRINLLATWSKPPCRLGGRETRTAGHVNLASFIKHSQAGAQHSDRQSFTVCTGSSLESYPGVLHSQTMNKQLMCVPTHKKPRAGMHTQLKLSTRHDNIYNAWDKQHKLRQTATKLTLLCGGVPLYPPNMPALLRHDAMPIKIGIV